MKTITLILLLFATPVAADELGFLVYTYHFDRSQPFNENNPGIFIEKNHFVFTAFNGSYGDDILAGGYVQRWNYKFMEFSILGGLVYGYGEKYQDPSFTHKTVLPYFVPTLTANLKYFDFNVHYIVDAVAASISVPF